MDKSKSFNYFMPVKDIDSLKQECYGYLKTKQFMAERIFEQQKEIESLKNQVFFHSIKHIQLYDWLKFMNEQMKLISNSKKEKNDITLSQQELENSFIYENGEEIDKHQSSPKKFTIENNPANNNNKLEELNKIIEALKSENIDLKKQNEQLKVENLEKNIIINKLKSEKFLLFNELNELVNSLKSVDMKLLNKFYKKLYENRTLTRNDMPNSLGIKYNIITAQNQLAFLIHSDLVTSKSFNESYSKITQALDERQTIKTDCLNFSDKINQEKDFIDLENYVNIISKFEKDFQRNFESKLHHDKPNNI